jgi:hypothetical protein
VAGPAAASELINGLQAGAFFPGLVGDDPLRCAAGLPVCI